MPGLTIEYPLDLIDQIRLSVTANFHTGLHEGIGIGGVFYGRRSENALRIESWQPIKCEHAQGASFLLSQQELLALKSMSQSSERIGWFVSHTDGDLALTPGDRILFDQCFPRRGQFALVLAPARIGPTRAALWVRRENGEIDRHAPDREFTIAPLYATRARRLNQHPVDAQPLPPRREEPPTPRRYSWRVWLGVSLVLLAAAIPAFIVGQRSVPALGRSSLSLKLQDGPGAQLRIAWDRSAIGRSQRGVLEIEDGKDRETVTLEPPHTGESTVTYARHSGEVKVRLAVYDQGRSAPAFEEAARFVGLAPGQVERERAELRAEVERLRAELAKEQEKGQRRERLIRELEDQ